MAPLLGQLLQLPDRERAELALALWESLSDREQARCIDLTAAEREELERRWDEHSRSQQAAVPWSEVRRKLHAPK